MKAKNLSAGAGVHWFSCGWYLFKQDFGTWLIMFIFLIVLSILLSFIPFIGSLSLMIISPALMAGFMFAASELDNGNKIEIGYLFQGFRDKERMNKLLILGGIYLLAQVLLLGVMVALVGGSAWMSSSQAANIDPAAMMTSGMGLSMLVALFFTFAITLGFIYATPLVMLDNMAPVDSIKASYSAGFITYCHYWFSGL